MPYLYNTCNSIEMLMMEDYASENICANDGRWEGMLLLHIWCFNLLQWCIELWDNKKRLTDYITVTVENAYSVQVETDYITVTVENAYSYKSSVWNNWEKLFILNQIFGDFGGFYIFTNRPCLMLFKIIIMVPDLNNQKSTCSYRE